MTKTVKYTNKLPNRSREWIPEQIREKVCHFREIHNEAEKLVSQCHHSSSNKLITHKHPIKECSSLKSNAKVTINTHTHIQVSETI